MSHIIISRCKVLEVAVIVTGLLLWPALGAAQNVSGQARAIQATVMGATAVLADTGTLDGPDDARQASLLTGSIPGLGGMEAAHATTIGSGADAGDSVASEASIGNLNLTIAGNAVSADFAMARAIAPANAASTGTSLIDGLVVNGAPVTVTGAPNQTIPLVGGRLVLNEQQVSATGIVVNAIHLVADGLADVVVASASSGVTPSTTSP